MAYAMMQVRPCQIVVGVKMIWVHISYAAGGVYQTIRGGLWGWPWHPQSCYKKAKGVPLAEITSGIKSVACHLKVNLYLLDEV